MSECERGPVWHGVSPDALRWLDFGEEHLLFHAGSGDTHLLDSLSAAALRLVCDRPLTVAELATLLREREGMPAGEPDENALALLMKRLRRLGLVDEVKPC